MQQPSMDAIANPGEHRMRDRNQAWMRSRIPLLYYDSALVAVGDLWLSDKVRQAEGDGPAWRVKWSDHPPME